MIGWVSKHKAPQSCSYKWSNMIWEVCTACHFERFFYTFINRKFIEALNVESQKILFYYILKKSWYLKNIFFFKIWPMYLCSSNSFIEDTTYLQNSLELTIGWTSRKYVHFTRETSETFLMAALHSKYKHSHKNLPRGHNQQLCGSDFEETLSFTLF